MNVQCSECGRVLLDWQGNVMVNADRFIDDGVVDGLKVICKPCTNHLDASGLGMNWHSLWELRQFPQNLLELLDWVGDDLISKRKKWSPQAVKDFLGLIGLLWQSQKR